MVGSKLKDRPQGYKICMSSYSRERGTGEAAQVPNHHPHTSGKIRKVSTVISNTLMGTTVYNTHLQIHWTLLVNVVQIAMTVQMWLMKKLLNLLLSCKNILTATSLKHEHRAKFTYCGIKRMCDTFHCLQSVPKETHI